LTNLDFTYKNSTLRNLIFVSLFVICIQDLSIAQVNHSYKIPTVAHPEARVALLKQQWDLMQQSTPKLGVRDCFLFILDAMDTKLYNQKDIEWLLDKMATRVITDPKDINYGNIYWNWVNPKNGAEDNNNVEFCVQYGILIKLLYDDQLSDASRKTLDTIFEYALAGISNANVRVSYTNIYLMRIWNLIALGQVYKKPQVVEQGRTYLNLFIKHIANYGNREYDSPTYGGVDLESLLLLSQFAQDKDIQNKTADLLNLFLTDFCSHYNPLGGFLGGAHSRDYNRAFARDLLEEKYLNPLLGKANNNNQLFHQICYTRLHELGLSSQQKELMYRKNKFIIQKWDSFPNAYATDYIGKKVSIASANQTYSPDDKTFVIYLSSKKVPEMANITYVMEGRDDHYGQWASKGWGDKYLSLQPSNYPLNGGWGKTRHLMPFMQVAQNKNEFVMLVSGQKDHNSIKDYLNSTILLPNVFDEIWVGNKKVNISTVGNSIGLDHTKTFFTKFEDVVVAFRILYEDASKNESANIINDGFEYNSSREKFSLTNNKVIRMTLKHSNNGNATIAMWWKTIEGIKTDAAFAKFRASVLDAPTEVINKAGILDIAVMTSQGKLGVKADLNLKKRLAYYNPNPLPDNFLFNVDGFDIGKKIMQKYQ
jgi:hypothetical protein